MHGAILNLGWRFAKIAAISPKVYTPERICKNCDKFVLTTDMLQEPGGLKEWWMKTGLLEGLENINQTALDESNLAFQLFFNRLVNLSAVRLVPDPHHSWLQVQGDNPRHMGAGYTKTPIQGATGVDDALKSSHNAYKILYFNKDQHELLINREMYNVLFFCDFGSGKIISFVYLNILFAR